MGDTLLDGRVVTGHGNLFCQQPIQTDSLHAIAVFLTFDDPALDTGNGNYLVSF